MSITNRLYFLKLGFDNMCSFADNPDARLAFMVLKKYNQATTCGMASLKRRKRRGFSQRLRIDGTDFAVLEFIMNLPFGRSSMLRDWIVESFAVATWPEKTNAELQLGVSALKRQFCGMGRNRNLLRRPALCASKVRRGTPRFSIALIKGIGDVMVSYGIQQFMFRSILVVTLVANASVANAAEPGTFECKEPLPAFTLDGSSNPTDAQLTQLCGCIWSKLPEGGWERKVSAEIKAGQDPGWRAEAFPLRFGAAVEACGGRDL